MERILYDTNGEIKNTCPKGHEYLNDLSTEQLQSLLPAIRPDVDEYIWFLITTSILIDKGVLEDKKEYQMQEFLEANMELGRHKVRAAMRDKLQNTKDLN